MITEIIEFAGFDGHLTPICISARNSRLDGDGCFDLLDKLEFVNLILFGSKQTPHPVSLHNNPALYKKHSFLHSKAVYQV